MKNLRLLVAALLCSIFLAACNSSEEGSQESTDGSEKQQTEQPKENQTEENQAGQEQAEQEAPVMKADEVVAVVNGEEIKGEQFNLAYNQTQRILQQHGQESSSTEQLKEQTLQTLIDQELLRQDAAEKGITADEAKVEENFQQVKEQFESEEQYQNQLDKLGISEKMLKEQISYSLLLGKYVESELTVSEVSDTEVKEYYEQAVNGVENPPALEEVETKVREQLIQQREQEQVAEKVQELRAESEIETKV